MSVRSDLTAALDYEWSSLKGDSYPQEYPDWVHRLRNRIDLWLDGESEFEYVQLEGAAGAAESAPRLRVFGLTHRFALLVIITKQGGPEADVLVDWYLSPRTAITELDVSPKNIPGKEWLVITAKYEGWPESFTFPQDDDWRMDTEARKALFLKLRDDLFPQASNI